MPPAAEKIRDAERSREAILDAAERLFADRGFEGASLNEIGAAAGLSRATPSYFFGSKDQLYAAVLERAFADRQAATADALAPVHAWCADDGAGVDALGRALARATDDYLRFLLGRPTFVQLLNREELAGGARLRATPRASTAMTDAFGALRAAGRRRGLRAFRVEDAVLLYVMLTFGALGYGSTLLRAQERDLRDDAVRRRHVRLVVDQVLHLLTG